MEENHNESNFRECKCNEENWIKFAFIALAVFLGVFFATYYIMDQIRHSYGVPYRMNDLDRILEEQDRAFNRFNRTPIGFHSIMQGPNPVTLEQVKDENAYKLIIDLKPFDNNIKNVKVNVDGKRVTVEGVKFKDRNNKEDLYTFSQTILLPEEIDSATVTQEKVKDKLVVTMHMLEGED